MAAKKSVITSDTEGLLKAMLVFARTVEKVLETRVVAVIGEPLSQTKIHILRLLGQSGSQTSTRVALFLGISKPAVTQMIDAMVADKLVSRNRTQRDRREVELRLAPKGKRVFEALDRQQHQFVGHAARNFPQRRLGEWTAILNEMTTSLADADSKFQDFCVQCGAHPDDRCVLVNGEKRCPFLLHAAQVARRAAAKEAT